MPRFLRSLLEPLRLAGLVTLGAVALSFGLTHSPYGPWRWIALVVFVLGFIVTDHVPARLRLPVLLLEALAALALLWLEARTGTTPVLTVILVAQAAMRWPRLGVWAMALGLNVAMYVILSQQTSFGQPWLVVSLYGGFQAFAALTTHYAARAEQARDALMHVNADLLATRALLADSARDAERLRLARELHDVAGHKLTAMRLNLRRLAGDPAFATHPELALAEQLSAELLADIRNVVRSMRDDQGLDLGTALRALAAPFPRPALRVEIEPQVRVRDPHVAEAVLRLAQEALTNAARHADADHVVLHLSERDGMLRVDIEDDGSGPLQLCEGNGIAGMRERVAALKGQLELGRGTSGGLRLSARLPA
ncbi:MAG TPA: histidine kinase [Stenotrophomonas sp.]|nr:histidine kinase [Stenotrophomonas sp.]